MTLTSATRSRFRADRNLAVFLLAAALVASGCQVAPSKTVKGAGTGAAAGAVVGGLAGSGSSSGSGTGMLAGAAAGAVIGGAIGMVQDMKERKEQDRLAQERAYQQELARKRAEEASAKASFDEELAVAQGFRISDLELNEAQKKVDDASSRLNRLREERNTALSKKKALDEAQDRLLATEAEIARLEEELSRLRGETPEPTAEKQTNTTPPRKPGT